MPRMVRALRRARYIMITMKGLKFVENWYTARHIPYHLTRLYQLLLKLIWMKGNMTTTLATRSGYGNEVVQRASAEGHVTISNTRSRPSEAIQNTIDAMIGSAPREIYA